MNELGRLNEGELRLIQVIRNSGKFCDFTVEKRPTHEFPDGEIARVVVSESIKITDRLRINK